MPVTLQTERLLLRQPRETDLGFFEALFDDPAVTRYLGDGSTRSRERVRRSFRNGKRCWREHGWGPFVIDEGGALVGDCMLYPIARSGTDSTDFAGRGPEVEIGYRLARGAWGRGIATEAAGAVLRWATESADGPRLARVLGVTHPENAASQRVLEKIGMRRVGPTEAYYDTTTVLFEAGGSAGV